MYVVYSTVEKKEDAEKIAKHLVDKKTVACVNVIRIENSYYRWKGETQVHGEYLLIIKVAKKNYGKLEWEIGRIHPYNNPELIAFKIEKSIKKYHDWVKLSCL